MWSNKVLLLLGILTFCNFIIPNLAETPTDTASQAIEILQQNCGSSGCHGGPGGYRFNVHDPGSLLTAKVVEPGNAAASELIQRVEAGIMPLGGYQRQRGVKLPVQDIRVLRAWIDSGAQVPLNHSPGKRHTLAVCPWDLRLAEVATGHTGLPVQAGWSKDGRRELPATEIVPFPLDGSRLGRRGTHERLRAGLGRRLFGLGAAPRSKTSLRAL